MRDCGAPWSTERGCKEFSTALSTMQASANFGGILAFLWVLELVLSGGKGGYFRSRTFGESPAFLPKEPFWERKFLKKAVFWQSPPLKKKGN